MRIVQFYFRTRNLKHATQSWKDGKMEHQTESIILVAHLQDASGQAPSSNLLLVKPLE